MPKPQDRPKIDKSLSGSYPKAKKAKKIVRKIKPALRRAADSQDRNIRTDKKQNFNRSDGQYNPNHPNAAQSSKMGNPRRELRNR